MSIYENLKLKKIRGIYDTFSLCWVLYENFQVCKGIYESNP
ncbi:hypothetical protein HanIR_Chr13g0625591 [Helianthus annuus]|nr:hypothetical protein HanIR_Chr13g0625591 [Helianthus annuus]